MTTELPRRSVLLGGLGGVGMLRSRPSTTAVRKAGTPLQGWSVIAPDRWPTPGLAAVARPITPSITVFRKPDRASGGVTLTEGQAVVGKVGLLICDEVEGWVQVLVPARPNMTVGWVPLPAVRVVRNDHRILIELGTSTLTWTVGGKLKFRERVSTGTGDTPTPVGMFAVKEVVPQKDTNTVVGPFAVGLTAFSEVLEDYAGGQGTVAIHGTNAPGKLGQRVSKGCIRLPNTSITTLATTVPLGTPVEIVQKLADLPKKRWTYSGLRIPPSTSIP
jgi:lipoprotein-anchoring transpeptidase ErfK/SrfK